MQEQVQPNALLLFESCGRGCDVSERGMKDGGLECGLIVQKTMEKEEAGK